DYPHKYPSYGQFFFHYHSKIGARRKTSGKGQIGQGIVNVLNDLANSQKPDQCLKKSQKRCYRLPPVHYEHYPERVDGNIAHPGYEDKEWHNEVGKNVLAYSQ